MRSRTVFRSEGVLVLGMVLLVALVWTVERSMGAVGRTPVGVVPGLVLAVVPALLWLAFFYRQDRHEPEPLTYVGGVFLLGALVAAPLASWLENLVGAHDWCLASKGFATYAVGSFLTYGIAQEFSKYAVVRFTVYLSAEFDEPVDGIIYMTAAGLGFATAKNFNYITDTGGVYLTVGTVNVVVTALAHASFAAITGYFMGSARFGTGRFVQLRLLAGVLLAAAVNALFGAAHTALVSGATFVGHVPAVWRGLALYGGGVVLIFALVFWLIRRHVAVSPHAPAVPKAPAGVPVGATAATVATPAAMPAAAAPASGPTPMAKQRWLGVVRQLDVAVLVGVFAVVLGGWELGTRHLSATDAYTSTSSGVTFRFPQGWVCTETSTPDLGEVADIECIALLSEGAGKSRFDLTILTVGPEVRTFGVKNYLDANRPADRPLYAEISSDDGTLTGMPALGGNPALRTEYAYAWREPMSTDVPVVMHGVDEVALKNDRLYIVTFTADEGAFERERKRFESILGSVVIP